jgi:hypothetical protein
VRAFRAALPLSVLLLAVLSAAAQADTVPAGTDTPAEAFAYRVNAVFGRVLGDTPVRWEAVADASSLSGMGTLEVLSDSFGRMGGQVEEWRWQCPGPYPPAYGVEVRSSMLKVRMVGSLAYVSGAVSLLENAADTAARTPVLLRCDGVYSLASGCFVGLSEDGTTNGRAKYFFAVKAVRR